MTVPFETLGPAQKGRWVYQVIGSDGPIPNPQRIRYLSAPPGQAASAVTAQGGPLGPISALTGYAQVVAGVASVVNLGLSVAILAEVRKQSQILREVQADVAHIKDQLNKLLHIAHRTDLNVAESHLREGLRYALERSWQYDEVDLVGLAVLLRGALEKFGRSLGTPLTPGVNRDVLLSADVRERAEAALHLLWAARRTALEAHNVACGGDASLVVRDDLVAVELRQLAEATALLDATRSRASEMGDEVRKHLHQSWRFYGDTGWYRRFVRSKLSERLETDLSLLRQQPAAKALLDEIGESETMENARKQGLDAFASAVESYLQTWLAHSDAGLLWRLRGEMDLQESEEYWSASAAWAQSLPSENADQAGVERGLDLRLATSAAN